MSLARALFGLVAALAILLVALHLLREPLTAAGVRLVSELGAAGVFVGVLAGETLPGVGFQPALLLGVAGGLSFWPLFGVTAAGTWIASGLMWALGRQLDGHIRPRLGRVGEFLRKHGGTAVAVASISPVPYGLVVLGAGATGVHFSSVAIGASVRMIKILVTLAVVVWGWT